ncbi:MAG: SDR family oxidoreductase [Kiloniellales bacterium]|nr:SDR family oxidoreductase [Kiloniellales bacterium]
MPLSDYRTALVTGASSGIGEAVVRELRGRGLTVHAAARREDRLAALARETGCRPLALDLRDRAAVEAALAGLEIDVLVNNAGVGRAFDPIHRVDPEDLETTVATNVAAALRVVRTVVPGMAERKRGHIVNIGSVAGLYPIISSVYGATKGAIHLFSQNLRIELRGTGVRITEICPGRVATEFFDAAFDEPARRDKIKDTGIEELTSEDVAGAILYALDAPWHVNVGLIEITPTEQCYGGTSLTPVEKE